MSGPGSTSPRRRALRRSVRTGVVPAPAPGGTSLLVHGGAWAIPDEELAAHREGLAAAVAVGRERLEAGAPAAEVVVEVVALLEGTGTFDAGCGAVLNAAGGVELDAGMMCGRTLRFGAVAATRRLRHPIRAARALLEGEGDARFLVGEAAEAFAAAHGAPLVDNAALVHDRERARRAALLAARAGAAPSGTVGCVARDRSGALAAATSTGGTPLKPVGRVGDSPLPGCGYYANAHAAAGATGWGEGIAAVLLSGRAVDAVAGGAAPETVVREQLMHLHASIQDREGRGAEAGLLLMNRMGRGAWGFTTPRMARAWWSSGREARVEV